MKQANAPAGNLLRSEERFDTQLPIRIRDAEGEAQNISSHGVYFETDVRQEIGALVNFTIEFTLYGHRQQLLCEGKVVRVQEEGGRIGVAARLIAPLFDEEQLPEDTAVAAASA